MVKTSIHEAGHALLHETAPGMYLPRPRKEVEAESVAFVVADAHGMPTDDYNFPYVAAWASSGRSSDPTREIAAGPRSRGLQDDPGRQPGRALRRGPGTRRRSRHRGGRQGRHAAEEETGGLATAVPVTETPSTAVGL